MRKTPPMLEDATEQTNPLPAGIDPVQVERLAAAKLSNSQFALALGIPLRQWIKLRRNNVIQAALNKGNNSADSHVEAALYSRAIGGVVTEERWERVTVIRKRNGTAEVDGSKVTTALVLTEQRVKTLAPDVLAQIFYLKNRQPDRWKDRTEQGVDVSPVVRLRELTGKTPEELAEMRRRIAERRRLLIEQGSAPKQLPAAGGEDATV